MPGIGFRPLGYYGGGMVPKKYAHGDLVEGDSTMYGAGTDPQPRLRNFQEFLQDAIGATEYDREFARDAYNIPPTTGGRISDRDVEQQRRFLNELTPAPPGGRISDRDLLEQQRRMTPRIGHEASHGLAVGLGLGVGSELGMTGTEADRIPNPVSFGEMVFQELNPGGAGVDSGVAQHYFELQGEYPEGYQPTGPSGVVMPNAIEQQFIAIEDSPEQVSPQQLYEFLARPEVQAALRNSQSSFIRERYEAYMSQLGGSGRISDSDVRSAEEAIQGAGTGAAYGSTLDATSVVPLFNNDGGDIPFVGPQY